MLMIRPGQLGAQLRGQDAHVPGQDDEVDVQLVDQVQQAALGPRPRHRVGRIGWHVFERDAVRGRERGQVGVIADDQGTSMRSDSAARR